jgi:hypothetical protein
VSMSDELKEVSLLKLILIVRFACATLDVGHPISGVRYFIVAIAIHFVPNYHSVK